MECLSRCAASVGTGKAGEAWICTLARPAWCKSTWPALVGIPQSTSISMKRQEQSHSVWIDAEQHRVEDRRGRFEIEGQGGRPMEGTGCAWKRRVGDLEGRSRSLTGERLEKQAGGPW